MVEVRKQQAMLVERKRHKTEAITKSLTLIAIDFPRPICRRRDTLGKTRVTIGKGSKIQETGGGREMVVFRELLTFNLLSEPAVICTYTL